MYGQNKVLAINGLAISVLTYSFGSLMWESRTCSSLIGEPGSSSSCTMSTILQQTRTDCMLLCNEGGRGCNRSRRCTCTSLALWGCTVTSVIVTIQIVYECDSGGSQYSIKRMVRRFTAQLRRNLVKNDASQNLEGSGTVASNSVFEQVPQMDAKHFCICNSSLRVRSWSGKPVHRQYRRFTEQSPVDRKETLVGRSLRAFLVQL